MSSLFLTLVKIILAFPGNSIVKHSFLIGQDSIGRSRNSGPFCHLLVGPKLFNFVPRVKISATFAFPSTQYHSSGCEDSWISPLRVAANVLNPYDSFWIIHLTTSESTIWTNLHILYLHSFSTNFLRRHARTAVPNSQ